MDTAMEANLGAAGHGPRTELNDEDYYPQGSWDTVFLVALLLLGLPANGLMAWLAGSQARHGAGTRLALLLLSLALSDFLFLAAATFQILEIQHGGHWPLGTAACRLYYFLWGVSYSSGLFLLTALSLDRCLLALCPHWYPGHRPARLPLWVCAGVWVLATLFSVPWLVFPEAAVWWYDLVICLDFWDSEELPLRMLEILGGFLPFLLLLVCHVLTQATACRTCCGHQPRPMVCHGFARVAKTILSTYVILRLPYQLAQLLYLAFLWDVYPGYLLWEALVYSDYLILLNSCLSPFLCLAASADLRALLRAVLSSFAAAACEEQPGSFTPTEPQTQVVSVSLTPPGQTAEGQPRLDPVGQPQENPSVQLQSDSVVQPEVSPSVQPRSNSVVQPEVSPSVQPRSNSVVQPEVSPSVQPRSNSVVQPEVIPSVQPRSNSVVQPEVSPSVQPRSNSVVQPEVSPSIQPWSNSVVQPEVSPSVQAQSNSVVQPEVDSLIQPPLDPVVQPEMNPLIQSQLEPMDQPQVTPSAQPQSNSVVQTQVDSLTQAQLDPVAQPQTSMEAQIPAYEAESASNPGEESSPSLSPDPTLGAPENLDEPAVLEGEGPSSVPPQEAPSAGPT